MPRDSLGSVLHYLRHIAGPSGSGEVKDADLLDRFARDHDEAAFELLLWRHGPMVLSLCRRHLKHEQDSEDAFQATFFALARKAAAIGKKEALASWLYKVAYRIACRARTRFSVLSNHGAIVDDVLAPEMEADVIWRDLRPALDQEVARLPESYRRVLVLCYLEGKTQEEAARLLGCPKGTVASQLARACDRLRRRFSQRGWALSSTVLAGVMATKSLAGPVPAELVKSTVQAALAYASGKTGVILSAQAVALTQGVLRMLWLNKLKMTATVLLAVALATTGIGLAVRHTWAGAGQEKRQAEPPTGNAKGQVAAGNVDDPRKEIADLRADMAKLRLSLESALKEIKSLQDALRQAATSPDRGALYRGKPKQYWIEQFKDSDPKYRVEAVEALSVLALKDKDLVRFWIEQSRDADPKYRVEAVRALGQVARRDRDLIPVLLTALKDKEDSVGHAAGEALGKLGPDVMPPLLELLQDKTSPAFRYLAAVALRLMGPAAKDAVPLLVQALKDEDRQLRLAAAVTLGRIGPEAKPAIPVLIDLLGVDLQSLDAKDTGKKIKRGSGGKDDSIRIIVEALFGIDPEVADILGGVLNAQAAPRRQAYEALKKKYEGQK